MSKAALHRRRRFFGKALEACRFGRPLLLLEETASTSDVVKARAEQGAREGLAVAAAAQTAGRGRQGRSWQSLPGKGVYLSALLRPAWPATEAVFLNMTAAVAVARALESFRPGPVVLKWPNDVLVGGRKIAGVLIEPRIRRNRIEFAAVGIGVNVLQTDEDLAPLGPGMATSMRLAGAPLSSCDPVIVRILQELDICYTMALQDDKSRILQEWTARRGAAPRARPAAGQERE